MSRLVRNVAAVMAVVALVGVLVGGPAVAGGGGGGIGGGNPPRVYGWIQVLKGPRGGGKPGPPSHMEWVILDGTITWCSPPYGLLFGLVDVHRYQPPYGLPQAVRSICLWMVVRGSPKPPAPPTGDQILKSKDLPLPGIGIDPQVRGLTGLQTWLWYEGAQTVHLSLSLAGYSVTASVRAVRFSWTSGDGGVYVVDLAGSEGSPAVRHIYQAKSTYRVGLQVAWAGSYTVTGLGRHLRGPLGPVSVANSRRYPVVEVRSVLVGS